MEEIYRYISEKYRLNLSKLQNYSDGMPGLKVTLEQWRALQAVVDAGGYAQAASQLNRSQSSLSHAVAKLQAQLGVRLLRIEGRKAVLTEQGVALLNRSRQLVQDAAALEQFAVELSQGWEADIQLVVDAAFPAHLLMTALQRFKPVSRGSRVHLTQVVMSGADEAIEEGWADLVIGGYHPTHLLGDVLLEIDFVAVAHPRHALHQLGRELTLSDLKRELQVVVADSGVRQKRDSGWLPAEHRWTVTNIDNAIEAIRCGLGFCWLPRHRVDGLIAQGELLPLPLREGRLYRENMYLMFGKSGAPGPATQALAAQFRALVGEAA